MHISARIHAIGAAWDLHIQILRARGYADAV